MGDLEHGDGQSEAPKQKFPAEREAIKVELTTQLSLTEPADTELLNSIATYLTKETSLPDKTVIGGVFVSIAHETQGFGKAGLQEFLRNVPRVPFAELQKMSSVLDELSTHYKSEIEAAADKQNLSAVFPNANFALLVQAVNNAPGVGTAQVDLSQVKKTYDELVAKGLPDQAGEQQEVHELADQTEYATTIQEVLAATFTGDKLPEKSKWETYLNGVITTYVNQLENVSTDKQVKTILAQGILAWYLPLMNTQLEQGMNKTELTELLQPGPFDADNDVTSFTPENLASKLKAYLDGLNGETPSRQAVSSELGGAQQTQLGRNLQFFLATYTAAEEPGFLDGPLSMLKKAGGRISKLTKGAGEVLDGLYKEYGPQLREMLATVQGFFKEFGLGGDRDVKDFEQKLEVTLIRTKGTLDFYEHDMVQAIEQVLYGQYKTSLTPLGLTESLDDVGLQAIGSSLHSSLSATPDLDASLQGKLEKSKNYTKFMKHYAKENQDPENVRAQQIMQENLNFLATGDATSPASTEQVQSAINTLYTNRKERASGSIVISSPQKFIQMLTAYLLTNNEEAALKLALQYKETKSVPGAQVDVRNMTYANDACFVDIPPPADAAQKVYYTDSAGNTYPYDANTGIKRGDPVAAMEKVTFFLAVPQADGSVNKVAGTEKEKQLQRDTDRENVVYNYQEVLDADDTVTGKIIPKAAGIDLLLVTGKRTPPKEYEYVMLDAGASAPMLETAGTKYDPSQDISLPLEKDFYVRDVADKATWHKIEGKKVGITE